METSERLNSGESNPLKEPSLEFKVEILA